MFFLVYKLLKVLVEQSRVINMHSISAQKYGVPDIPMLRWWRCHTSKCQTASISPDLPIPIYFHHIQRHQTVACRHSSIFLTDDEMTGEDEEEDDMPELPEVMESYQDEKIIGEKEDEEEGEVEEGVKDEL